MVTMFNLMTIENWTVTLWRGIDASGIFQAPKINKTPGVASFFFIFIIIGTLIVLNLFVAVIIDTFFKEKEKLARTNDLTQTQRLYCDTLIKCYKSAPVK